jgi:hypothetical protein
MCAHIWQIGGKMSRGASDFTQLRGFAHMAIVK